jgi:1L-myo-inositol 1-phosphate cytidylyltransferase
MSKNIQRKGIILAAGLGSRMRNEKTDTNCKPLMLVDNISLLIRTIQSLEIASCERVIIVLGYQAEKIKNYIRAEYKGNVPLEFVVNHKYDLQNGISVLAAEHFAGNEFVLTMADHILSDEIMLSIRDYHPPKGGATLCVDFKISTIFDIQDATKVLAEASRIKKIGKDLKRYNCIDTGVFIGTRALMAAIHSVYEQRGDASLSEGVQLLASLGLMEILDIKDAFWQDVDNMDMLLHAEKLMQEKSESIHAFRPN